MDISHLRGEIDRIDDQIVKLFIQRMNVAARIADYKRAHKLPIHVPAREQEKLQDVTEKAGPEMAEYIKILYSLLFELSRGYQSKRNTRCGLLGRKLGHSYSPQIHALLCNYQYDLFEKEPEEIGDFLQNQEFTAINVTIPYKKDVLPYCAELSPQAKLLGSVNTILRRPDGSLFGENTDYYGFSMMLRRTGIQVEGKKVLVLGSGGASVTVQAVLLEAGANVVTVSRTGENNYKNLHLHRDTALIVNATPVGMFPNNGVSPVDLNLFPQLEGVLDLIYNPARTKLLLDAEAMGLIIENGLYMLIAQAKRAAEIFTGTAIPDNRINQIHQKLSLQMENIILIGMPGSGKSSVAQALGKLLGRQVADADIEITRLAGKPIPQIFTEQGEDAFRKFETEALRELCKRSGVIIATGGGCVTRPENYPLLHQNSRIFWIQRELSQLPIDGRPISQANPVNVLYAQREPLYRQFADYMIENNTTVEDAAQQIAAYYQGG